MSLIDDIKRDREAGTPGRWEVVVDQTAAQVPGFPCIHASNYTVVGTEGMYGDLDVDFANARRIARVPDMEAALLAADRVIKAFESCKPFDEEGLNEIDAAVSAYREATK